MLPPILFKGCERCGGDMSLEDYDTKEGRYYTDPKYQCILCSRWMGIPGKYRQERVKYMAVSRR